MASKIIVDAFGGDNAPLEVIKGCERAVRELGVSIILTGSEEKIKKCAAENGLSLSGIEIVHTDDVFDIHEEPKEIIKSGKNSSMALGLNLLSEGKGDAFVSAGSTGALVMGATFIVKRIKGIKRIAPSPILPGDKGSFILLDAGANTECRPEMLVQFAVMGSAYMEKVMGVKSPKVGLLNIGSEETKGRELETEAYKLLEKSGLNFAGNIEARDLPKGEVQVVVTDGFTGNIVLKLYEGMGSFFAKKVKWIFSGAGKLGAIFSLGKIKAFRKQMDYKEVGGSALLGVRKPVIKAHGSSDGTAFFNAVRQAKKCVEGNVAGVTESYVARMSAADKE
ncbi:phosphate acyltransferase PlsX [Ruminococcus flavefaciens]|uniref:Phosphate acyltransferase n=1 Tax=Ruminococcus flavefaciens TaxID=1265 RepID=A0A315Y207_RUMFL|nr:phosphate acyltransferase PlsX [Ruminococcus flavefaciens]PWJ14074.1 phosphate:acyl-[acyl carrier protein] acyltransferase [Ruminococcus flavefaciens]SSA43735.1 phosphate:acyl-[acyl carrier protein] acyltransferase [Ruminococcus flavefaciens]